MALGLDGRLLLWTAMGTFGATQGQATVRTRTAESTLFDRGKASQADDHVTKDHVERIEMPLSLDHISLSRFFITNNLSTTIWP
jgi:hypothetical protein